MNANIQVLIELYEIKFNQTTLFERGSFCIMR